MWSDTVMGTGCLFWGDKNVLKLTMVKKKKKKKKLTMVMVTQLCE